MEVLVPARLREFDEKRKFSPELLRLGSTPIEILVVDTNSTIRDVWKDNRFEYMSHVITIVVEIRSIMQLQASSQDDKLRGVADRSGFKMATVLRSPKKNHY